MDSKKLQLRIDLEYFGLEDGDTLPDTEELLRLLHEGVDHLQNWGKLSGELPVTVRVGDITLIDREEQ